MGYVDDDREAIVVVVRDDGTATHVGIDVGGRRAVYTDASGYADLSAPLKTWLYGSVWEERPGWEQAPQDLIWVHAPNEPNEMSAWLAALVASGQPPAARERVALNRWDFGADRELVEQFVAETAEPGNFVKDMGQVGIARYDLNNDGREELFIYLYRYLGCSGACTLHVFEGAPGARTSIAAMKWWYNWLDVWIDSATGYKTIFDGDDGLRWTGADYEWFCYRGCSRD